MHAHKKAIETFSENNDTSSSEEFCFDEENYMECHGCMDPNEELIYCSACKRTYHNNCHIPPIPEIMTYTNLESFESWICTMCIDMDDVSKVMSEGTKDPNKKTLDKNDIIMASRILLELIGDKENSARFIDCPPTFFFPDYYKKMFLPISINKVKKRLFSTNYYASFIDVIRDMKRIYSNAIDYYSDIGDKDGKMAQNQEDLLDEMLAKWVPQCIGGPSFKSE